MISPKKAKLVSTTAIAPPAKNSVIYPSITLDGTGKTGAIVQTLNLRGGSLSDLHLAVSAILWRLSLPPCAPHR